MSDPAGVLQPGGLSGALAGRAGVEVVLANWGGVRARPQTFDLLARARGLCPTRKHAPCFQHIGGLWPAASEAAGLVRRARGTQMSCPLLGCAAPVVLDWTGFREPVSSDGDLLPNKPLKLTAAPRPDRHPPARARGQSTTGAVLACHHVPLLMRPQLNGSIVSQTITSYRRWPLATKVAARVVAGRFLPW
jgi:hypothetical protein